MHLVDAPDPAIEDVAGGRGVLVQVLRVGVDATDREINEAKYGSAPAGADYLIVGHESLGRVIRTGPAVPPSLAPGTLVVATVRRPGGSKYDAVGLQDMTTDDTVLERGISGLHGYLAERYVDDDAFIVPLPDTLSEVGVLLEPLSISEKAIQQAQEIQRRLKVWELERAAVIGGGSIGLLATLALRLRRAEVVVYSRGAPPTPNSELVEALGATYVDSEQHDFGTVSDRHGPFDFVLEATGYSPLVWQAAEHLGKNGVLALASVTAGDRTAEIPSDRINQGFVLGNKVLVGTVNASRGDFERGVTDLVLAEAAYPGWLARLLTTPIDGLENWKAMLEALTEKAGIKVFVEVAQADPP